MKKKISKILGVGLTLALLTSLLLTAAPVSALTAPTVVPSSTTISATTSYAVSFNLGTELWGASAVTLAQTGSAVAAWSTTQKHSGTQSVKLTATGNDAAQVLITPPTGITLSDMATITSGWGWWYYVESLGLKATSLELRFQSATDPDGYAEMTVMNKAYGTVAHGGPPTVGAWTQQTIVSATTTGIIFGTEEDTTNIPQFPPAAQGEGTIAALVAHVIGLDANAGNWVLYDVRPTLGWIGAAQTIAYVDDITIGTRVYNLEQTVAAETITIVFPPTTIVPDGVLAGTVQASPGWVAGQWANATTTGVTFAGVALTRTVTATLSAADQIGEGATVRIQIPGITNPPAIGSYNLTVKTSKETTAVTSAAYSVGAPALLPLPGVVERRNSVGVLMAQTNSIQAAINVASVGDSINVGAGTYDEDIDITQSVTITGTAATTIIKDTNGNLTGGTVTISFVGTATVAGAVFDGFTVMGRPGVDALTITGEKVTVQNCIFTKAGIATTAVAQNLIHYNPTALPTLASTITNCTFDTTLGTVVDNGVLIAASANAIGLTVSNSTFTVDGTIGLEDSAVNTAGVGTTLLPITISGNTITGGSGIGVTFTAGVATASDNTLTGLNQAFKIVAGTATIKGNTIDNCGLVISTTAAVGKAAIGVTTTTALSITNNTITNSPNDIIEITLGADSSLINMMFNNLTDNVKGIDNDDTVTTNIFNATHNWWGAATGPATGFNVTDGAVNDTAAYLGGVATGSFTNTVGAASLLTKTTVGVDVIPSAVLVAGEVIGVANYAMNPQDATPLPALDGGFYDVYVVDVAPAFASVLIKFYNANITANTDIYVWGTIAGGWVPVTAPVTVAAPGVNLYEGYAFATITATTTPSIAALAGTPFALVAGTAVVLDTPALLVPEIGADDISLTPTFGWGAVTDADSYVFQLADNPLFVTPLVNLVGYPALYYTYKEDLDYSTPYYWRVRAKSATLASDWGSGVFITMDEPVEPVEPVEPADIILEPADIILEQPDIIVTPPAVTPITPNWIYVIIGVGAVLVIALLVLIVRTRRVA